MFSKTKTISSIFASLIIIFSAEATPIVQKQTFFSATPNFSTLLTFNKFNPPGILSSVQITLQLQINGGSVILDNDGNQSAVSTLKFGVFGNAGSTDVNMPSLSNETVYSQSFNLSANVGDGPGDYDPTPPDGMQYTGDQTSGTISVLVDDKFLANYIGTGTYQIGVGVMQIVDYGDIDNIEYCIVSPVETGGYIEVDYNVPEPTAFCLLITGLLMINDFGHRSYQNQVRRKK